MLPPSSLVPLRGWGLIDLSLRASNEGLLRPRVARAQKIIRLHPLLFFNILLSDGWLQAHSGLHGVGNQTVRLGFLDQLLGFGRIGVRRKRDGRLQRDGRELKLPIDQFQLPFGRTLVRGKDQPCSLRHREERRHQTDIGGRDK